MSGNAEAGEGRKPSALTIAGFDPGSGAGVTADLLTFSRFGMFTTSVITALTVQSTRGVRRVEPVDAGLLREMLEELESDLPANGVKIGMLGGVAQVRVVVDFLRALRARRAVSVVLDPVLVSSSGAVLLDKAGLALLHSDLLPLVDVATPNAPEAALLAGLPCDNAAEAELCAAALAARYPRLTPVITGGHLEPPSDLVWLDGRVTWITGERLRSMSTHGTGCAFSSALLAGRLLGQTWPEACTTAKTFVTGAIRTAEPRGAWHGPMNLLCAPKESRSS